MIRVVRGRVRGAMDFPLTFDEIFAYSLAVVIGLAISAFILAVT